MQFWESRPRVRAGERAGQARPRSAGRGMAVCDQPQTIRVAQVLSAYNILQGSVRDGRFEYGGSQLPLPPRSDNAQYYAIRFESVSIVPPDDPSAMMRATFVASEFTGGGVTYFLRGPEGVFEVERHLSRADPQVYKGGETLGITWNANDALAFGSDGVLINNSDMRGAAY